MTDDLERARIERRAQALEWLAEVGRFQRELQAAMEQESKGEEPPPPSK